MNIPKNKFLKLVNYFRHPQLSRLFLSFMHNGYLLQIGWIESWRRNECLDENGEPIPWAPYPFINFMKEYLNHKMTVFEYGSGYSTLFFAKRVHHVYSVEHNSYWIEKINSYPEENITLYEKELNEDYEKSIHNTKINFDVIFIDGRRRINCVREALKRISDDGMIIFDDSDRDKYKEGINLLLNQDYKKIDFWGITPLAFINRKTTIFFKNL